MTKRCLDAVYGDERLSLEAANELDSSDAKLVKAISGGNKVQ